MLYGILLKGRVSCLLFVLFVPLSGVLAFSDIDYLSFLSFSWFVLFGFITFINVFKETRFSFKESTFRFFSVVYLFFFSYIFFFAFLILHSLLLIYYLFCSFLSWIINALSFFSLSLFTNKLIQGYKSSMDLTVSHNWYDLFTLTFSSKYFRTFSLTNGLFDILSFKILGDIFSYLVVTDL